MFSLENLHPIDYYCCRSNQIVSSTVLLLVIALVTLARAQYHHPSQFRSQAVVNAGFIPSIPQEDEDKVDDSTPSGAINYRQSAPAYEYDEEEEEQRPTVPNQIRRQQPFLQPQRPQQQQQPIRQQPGSQPSKNRFEDELEPEEPDRLALALEKSTFQCEGRTGYVYVLNISIKFIINRHFFGRLKEQSVFQ